MRSSTKTLWILASVLLAGVATFATSASEGGKDEKKAKKKIVNLLTHEIIGELRAAHKYLEMANHDYKGHRAKASHEISDAIKALEEHHHAHHKTKLNVTVPHPHPLHHHHLKAIKEPQALSDMQVKIAGDIARTVQAHITALPNNKHTTAAARHVTDAIVEVQIALVVSPIVTPKK